MDAAGGRTSAVCPVCSCPHRTLRLSTTYRLDLRTCTSCGHTFATGPGALPEALEGLYDNSFGGFFEDPVFADRLRMELDKRFVPRRSPPGRILDVGCGNGEFLQCA